MTHQESAAEDRRQDEAAADQEAEVNESGVRGLSTTPGTQQFEEELDSVLKTQKAKEVRDDVQKVAEEEAPSFEEAMQTVADTTAETSSELNLKLLELAKKYSELKLISLHFIKGMGWECRKQADTLESEDLANAINDKVDMKEMVQQDKINPEVMKGLIKTIKSAKSLTALREVKKDARKIDHNSSKEFEQAFLAKEEELEAEVLQKKIARVAKKVGEINHDDELERYTYSQLDRGGINKGGIVKKINPKKVDGKLTEWTVESIDGKPGSEEVVKIVLDRKKAIKNELEQRVAKVAEKVSEIKSDYELAEYANKTLHEEGAIYFRREQDGEWGVTLKRQVPGSREVAKIVLDRKEVIENEFLQRIKREVNEKETGNALRIYVSEELDQGLRILKLKDKTMSLGKRKAVSKKVIAIVLGRKAEIEREEKEEMKRKTEKLRAKYAEK